MRNNNPKDPFKPIRQKYLDLKKREEEREQNMSFFEWIVKKMISHLIFTPLLAIFFALSLVFLGLVLAFICLAIGAIMPLWLLVLIYRKVFNNDNDNNKSSTVNPSIRLARRDPDA